MGSPSANIHPYKMSFLSFLSESGLPRTPQSKQPCYPLTIGVGEKLGQKQFSVGRLQLLEMIGMKQIPRELIERVNVCS